MTTARWHRIQRIFSEAIERPAEERAPYVEERCANDDRLCREVLELLDADSRAESPVDEPAPRPSLAALSDSSEMPDPMLGCRLGAYRIVEHVAEGGMGVVYRAVRDDDRYHSEVAIKVVRRSASSPEVQRRFRAECQVLATLRHPNIARLLDAGTTPDGLPYLVMEYLPGLAIDEYADRHGLSLTQRLHLFAQVCRALHHAHQNLVVHRDLKPSNVIVTEDGVPRLLDFGIAKILADPPVGESERTVTRARMLTPQFASPEQVRGDSITAASDVYALGVLLCRLLTGRGPYRLTTPSLLDIERAICDQPPNAPSSLRSFSPEKEASCERAEPHWDESAHARGLSPAALKRALKGDLDNIVLMALRKDPRRRYASAERMAADIEDHLAGRPIRARPESVLYTSAKFVSRHRVGVTLTVALVILLSVGIVHTSRLAREASEGQGEARRAEVRALAAANRADTEATSARQLGSFLIDTFLSSRPFSEDELRLAGRRLDHQARQARSQYVGEPALLANLLGGLGRVAMELRLLERARELLEEARRIREELDGASSPSVALSLRELGELALLEGRTDEAVTTLRACLQLQRTLSPEDASDVAGVANDLAVALNNAGEWEEALELHQESLALRRTTPGEHRLVVAESLNNLAAIVKEHGDPEEALEMLREALRIRRRVLGDDHSRTIQSMTNLAISLHATARLEESATLYGEAADRCRELHGAGRESLAHVLTNHAVLLQEQGALERAAAALWEASEIQRSLFGEEHPRLASTLVKCCNLAIARGEFEEALEHADRAVEILQLATAIDPRRYALTLQAQGNALAYGGESAQARDVFEEVLEILAEVASDDLRLLGTTRVSLGICHLREGDRDESERCLRDALAELEQAPGITSRELETVRGYLQQVSGA